MQRERERERERERKLLSTLTCSGFIEQNEYVMQRVSGVGNPDDFAF